MAKTYLAALLQGKCPRCHEGDIFTYRTSKISKFNVMNKVCPCCGVMLEPEPGFYQGAMYVGYGFTMLVIIAISVILSFLGEFSQWTYISLVIGVMIIVAPLNYRYSRIFYLYLFGGIKFKPESAQIK